MYSVCICMLGVICNVIILSTFKTNIYCSSFSLCFDYWKRYLIQLFLKDFIVISKISYILSKNIYYCLAKILELVMFWFLVLFLFSLFTFLFTHSGTTLLHRTCNKFEVWLSFSQQCFRIRTFVPWGICCQRRDARIPEQSLPSAVKLLFPTK